VLAELVVPKPLTREGFDVGEGEALVVSGGGEGWS
jgi:hypothetical protein